MPQSTTLQHYTTTLLLHYYYHYYHYYYYTTPLLPYYPTRPQVKDGLKPFYSAGRISSKARGRTSCRRAVPCVVWERASH
jgi:hypothetical protein